MPIYIPQTCQSNGEHDIRNHHILGFPNNFWTHFALHQNQQKLPSRKSLPRTRTSTNACAERTRDPGDGHFLGRFCCALCLQTNSPKTSKTRRLIDFSWFLKSFSPLNMLRLRHVRLRWEMMRDEHCQPWFMAKPSLKVITQHGFRTIPAR